MTSERIWLEFIKPKMDLLHKEGEIIEKVVLEDNLLNEYVDNNGKIKMDIIYRKKIDKLNGNEKAMKKYYNTSIVKLEEDNNKKISVCNKEIRVTTADEKQNKFFVSAVYKDKKIEGFRYEKKDKDGNLIYSFGQDCTYLENENRIIKKNWKTTVEDNITTYEEIDYKKENNHKTYLIKVIENYENKNIINSYFSVIDSQGNLVKLKKRSETEVDIKNKQNEKVVAQKDTNSLLNDLKRENNKYFNIKI